MSRPQTLNGRLVQEKRSRNVNVIAATHMLQPAPLQPVRTTEMEPDHFDKLFFAISSIANGQQELFNAMREAGRKRKAVDLSHNNMCDEETRVEKGKRTVETAKKQRVDVNTEYSEGEYSSGDKLVDQIDSTLTEGPDIMKPSSSHSQDDDDIDVAIMAHDFNTDEDVEPEINTQLAAIFNNMLSKRLSEEKLKPKIELYPTHQKSIMSFGRSSRQIAGHVTSILKWVAHCWNFVCFLMYKKYHKCWNVGMKKRLWLAGVKKSLVLEPGTSKISVRTSIYFHPMSGGQVKHSVQVYLTIYIGQVNWLQDK